MHGRISQAITIIMVLALLITGCTSQAYNIGMAKDKENNVVDTGFSVSTVGSYDSADTAVVMAVDQENSCVVFMNMDTGKQYTLYYDGTTYVTDKYDGPMTISQIRAGDVVDVNFLKGKRQIASIKESPSAWVYESIDNYDLGGMNKTASIGSSTYFLPDEAVILSEGRRVEVMDVVAQDLVTIRGIDREIYSVNVERGHGYLRLRNEQALLGGWIEVGNTVIRRISEDMLLVVPEGSYQVALSNGGVSSTKEIVIERDRETVLDVGDIEIVQDKTGRILFSVTPANAEVTIDGNVTDTSSAVELPYGIHQVHLEAEGYDSLTKYIQVGSEYAKISFVLEEKKEDTSSVSENTVGDPPQYSDVPELETTPVEDPSVSENTISPTTSNKVYIDSPKGVEVYVDDYYVGVAPVSFKKNIGKHTVTLRKTGYKNKSYTIYLYNDGEDITYSFSDLEKEEEDSVSDNNLSSSTTSTQNPSEDSTKNPSSGSSGTPSDGSTETPPPVSGDGPGDNDGTSDGSGDNDGTGDGPGDNSGTGDGSGDNSGTGDGSGDNSGTGDGSGDNSGTGDGSGDNSGTDDGPGDNGDTGDESGDNGGTEVDNNSESNSTVTSPNESTVTSLNKNVITQFSNLTSIYTGKASNSTSNQKSKGR